MENSITFTPTESAKALADALIPGEGDLSWLSSQLSLNETIKDQCIQFNELTVKLDQVSTDNQKYRDSYKKIRDLHNVSLSKEAGLQARILELEVIAKQVATQKQLVASLSADNLALKAKLSYNYGWEDIYQSYRGIFPDSNELYNSPAPKLMEVMIKTMVNGPTKVSGLHFTVKRINATSWVPLSKNVY